MGRDVTRRQQLAWCFGAAGVPVMLLCAAASWHWALAAGACALLYYTIVWRLWVRAGDQQSLAMLARRQLGKTGAVVLIAAALWTVTALADTARRSAAAFPGGAEAALCGTVLLALCAWGGARGTQVLGRAVAVLAPVLAGIHTVFLISALKQVRLAWCAPWGDASQLLRLTPVLLLPSAALFLQRTPGSGKMPAAMLSVLALAPAVFAAVTSGCLSPAVAQDDGLPFYTLSKSLSLLGVMERLEPLVSAVLYLSFFCLGALLTQAAATMLAAAFQDERLGQGAMPVAVCAAAFGLTFLPEGIPAWLANGGAAIFWGIVPLAILLVVLAKKEAKKRKK